MFLTFSAILCTARLMDRNSRNRSPGSIRILCEAAPGFGVAPETCLLGTGLVTFDLYGNDTKVSLTQEITAIENFLHHAPRRHGLGIEIGRRFRPEVFGIWGYAILSSPSFRAGLKVAMDYVNLSFLFANLELVEDDDTPRLIFDTSDLPAGIRSFVLERHLTVMANFSQEVLPGFSLSNLTFRTTVQDPDFATAVHSYLGVNVAIGCDTDAIVLPEKLLDLPLPKHDPAAMEYCLRQCQTLLNIEEDTQPNLTSQVREATLMEMGNDPTIVSIASKLGVSERTLRRRLSEEGSSFRKIYVEARLAIGYELLSTAGLDVSTVAWRTGYSEPSSFVRAFTRQYGYPPGSLRKRAGQSVERLTG